MVFVAFLKSSLACGLFSFIANHEVIVSLSVSIHFCIKHKRL